MRIAEKKDLRAMSVLLSELTDKKEMSVEAMEELWEFVNNHGGERLYVCECEGKVIGVLGFRIRENLEERSRFGEISVIVVDADHRKKGIGKQMMEFAADIAANLGCKGTWLVSGFGREEIAHEFYKKLGYVITGYRFVRPLPNGIGR